MPVKRDPALLQLTTTDTDINVEMLAKGVPELPLGSLGDFMPASLLWVEVACSVTDASTLQPKLVRHRPSQLLHASLLQHALHWV